MTASLSKSATRLTRLTSAALIAVSFAATSAAQGGSAQQPPPPLPVDQAFPLVASVADGAPSLHVDVLPGHYLYRARFEFRLDDHDVTKATLARMPKGKVKNDPNFGKVAVFEQPLKIVLPKSTKPAAQLTVVFQGCSEVAGVCYPPETRMFALTSGAASIKPTEQGGTSLKEQFRPQVSQ